MVYQKKSSITNTSASENEQYYTPYHGYNTRFSARLIRKGNPFGINKDPSEVIKFRRSSQEENEDTYLIENFENCSDRFSIASSNYLNNSFENLLEPEDKNACDEYLNKSLVKFKQSMDFDVPPSCGNDRKKWIKQGSIVFVVAVVGWYVNNIRLQLSKIRDEIESANGRISDIVDARLDTIYKLSEVNNMIKDLKKSQENYKFTIQKMIENEINKIYSDKTGRTDFALESAGGRVVQLSPGTENYGQPKSSLLGISLCEGAHGPRAMIQTGTSPGECWAFKGSNGGVIIKLLGPIKIDAVSLEHISKNISPSGDSTTAPKDFTVVALKSTTDRGTLLGQFSYQIDGPLVQMFHISNPVKDTFEFVELRVLSNHGNPDFTCIYRFRVHGVMEK